MPNVDFFQQQRLYQAGSLKMCWRIFWGVAASTLSLGYLLDLLLTYVLVPVAVGFYCVLNDNSEACLPAFRFMNSTPVRFWGTVILTVIAVRRLVADAAAIQFTRDQGALVRLLRKIPTTPGESVIHIDGELPLKHLFFAPIDHAGRQMSDLQRTFNDNDRSIRERLEALAPGEAWSRM